MSQSITRTSSFTITEARYVASKMGADLRLLHNLYGRPSLSSIDDYVEETALLLRENYLATVDFGFRSAEQWKLRLRYRATVGGYLTDDRPGKFPQPVDVAGLTWGSYLIYTDAYHALSPAQRDAVDANLPVSRTGATEPSTGIGSAATGHGYSRNGTGVAREYFSAL